MASQLIFFKPNQTNMKKINYLLLAPAALMLASCSQEAMEAPAVNGKGNTTITVQLPKSMGSRADVEFGSGLTATNLNVSVFDASGNYLYSADTKFEPTNNTTEVNLDLIPNQTYTVAFFASANGNGIYEWDEEAATVTVNYNAMTNEGNLGDLYDCFSAAKSITGGTPDGVTLIRPVAQICWGTEPLDEENNKNQADLINKTFGTGWAYLASNFEANGIDNQLNVLTGETSQVGEDFNGDVTLSGFAAPQTIDQQFPAVGDGEKGAYQWIASQFVLVPTNGTTSNVTLSIYNTEESNVSSVSYDLDVDGAPLQANYQTLIYGNLFTSNTVLTVTKQAKWDDEIGPNEIEYGTQLTDGLFYDESTNTYTITSANGLNVYASQYGNDITDNRPYTGRTVMLGADIDMSTITNYVPFNNGDATFDGQNHTISNLTVTTTNGASAGLMTSALGTVKNLNFVNANITSDYKAGVLAGESLDAQITNVNVSNSTVTSTPWKKNGSTYDDGNNAGGIIGLFSAQPKAIMTNCSVDGCTIIGFRKVGGLVGFAETVAPNSPSFTGCSISNTTVTADLLTNYYGDYTTTSANLAGAIASNSTSGIGNEFVTGNTVGKNVNVSVVTTSIANASSLLGLATLVNNGRPFNGENFTVTSNIDLAGIEWTPIGNATNQFNGNFDGGSKNNYTISNLTVNMPESDFVGLFGHTGYVNSGSADLNHLQNITIVNANVTGNSSVGVLSGNSTGGVISNVKITGDVKVNGTIYVGGVVGTGYTTMSNITVDVNQANSLVSANSGTTETMVGGVMGHVGESDANSGAFTNITSNINVTGTGFCVGGVFGVAHYGTVYTDCSSTGNVSLTQASDVNYGLMVGGVAGGWVNAYLPVTFTGCSFDGTLSTNVELPEGYDLDEMNDITGIAYNDTPTGTLYIGNTTTNVASSHWWVGVTAPQD